MCLQDYKSNTELHSASEARKNCYCVPTHLFYYGSGEFTENLHVAALPEILAFIAEILSTRPQRVPCVFHQIALGKSFTLMK